MGYKVYGVLITILCIIQKIKLSKFIIEKNEISEVNRKLEWDNFKFQTKNRNLYYLHVLNQKEGNIREYFIRQNIGKVAIYGMDEVGKAFARLLIRAGINVCYGIDRSNNIACEDIEIRQVENLDDQMDIIIVAAEIYFKEIRKNIGDKVALFKLSEILEEILMTSEDY